MISINANVPWDGHFYSINYWFWFVFIPTWDSFYKQKIVVDVPVQAITNSTLKFHTFTKCKCWAFRDEEVNSFNILVTKFAFSVQPSMLVVSLIDAFKQALILCSKEKSFSSQSLSALEKGLTLARKFFHFYLSCFCPNVFAN